MTIEEYIRKEKQFGKLFAKVCKKGFSALSENDRNAYLTLQKELCNYDNERAFYELIRSGNYRIGY